MIKKIILQPHITEKTMNQTSQKKYTFIVDNDANKLEIAKKINKIYKVKVLNVKIINRIGKKINYKRMYKGKRKNFKLAIVNIDKKSSIKDFAIKE